MSSTHSRTHPLAEVDFATLEFGQLFSAHMFMMDYRDGKWQQGRVIPYGDMPLAPALSALHYGQSIFEGLKAYRTDDGEIALFRARDNFNRMNQSAERMCMPPIDVDAAMEALIELIREDHEWVPTIPGCSLYIRPLMFATDSQLRVRPSDTYRFLIITSPVGAYFADPVKVKVEDHYSRACTGGVGCAKTAGNYAASLLPTKMAQEEGYHQLIWTDAKEHAYIEESGAMNIMFVIDNTLITPRLSESILPGITRLSILEIAREWAIPIEERDVSVVEVIEAINDGRLQEAFGVGTAATVAPIQVISYQGTDYTIHERQPDSFSIRAHAYLDNVRYGRIDDSHDWIVTV